LFEAFLLLLRLAREQHVRECHFLRLVLVHSVRAAVSQGVPRAQCSLVEHLAQRSVVLEFEALFRPELELVRFRLGAEGSATLGTFSGFPAVRVG